MLNFMLNLLKKTSFKKWISGHFQITQENQNQSIWSRKISCNWQKIFFFDYLIRKDFNSTILVITKIYIFLFLYFTLVLLLIMQSQPTSIAWTVTSTAFFYLCWSYTKHSHLWIRCVAYVIVIVCLYERCKLIWFLI